jgi:hypothetical protein
MQDNPTMGCIIDALIRVETNVVLAANAPNTFAVVSYIVLFTLTTELVEMSTMVRLLYSQ